MPKKPKNRGGAGRKGKTTSLFNDSHILHQMCLIASLQRGCGKGEREENCQFSRNTLFLLCC